MEVTCPTCDDWTEMVECEPRCDGTHLHCRHTPCPDCTGADLLAYVAEARRRRSTFRVIDLMNLLRVKWDIGYAREAHALLTDMLAAEDTS